MLRSLALVVATLFLAACVTTTKEQYVEDGYRMLTGAEIVQLLAGNTVEARYGTTGRAFVDYFAPDGRVSTREPSTQWYIGSWEVTGDFLCFTYPIGAGAFPKCVEMAEKDGRYVQFRTSGPAYGRLGAEIMSITPGNVDNLPLE